MAKTATNEIRSELRKLIDTLPGQSLTQSERVEVSDTIVAVYVAGHIAQPEYQELMAYVR